MLDNVITLQMNPTDQTDAYALSRVDTDNGRSIYRFKQSNGDTIELTVANSVTKENSPFKTDRILLRLDYTVATLAKPELSTKSSVYCVLSTPRGDGANAETTKTLLQSLLRFIGGISTTPSGVASSAALASAGTLFDRLITGET